MGELRKIAIAEIKENPVALRAVNRESEDYMGLVDSIKEQGFHGVLIVRAKTDQESGQEYFELVDGLHRFSAAKDAGLVEVPVDIVTMDDGEVLEAQIMLNIHKIETRAIDYSRQLLRILTLNPLMTEAELAKKLGKSTAWIQNRLGLTKIDNDVIAALIDEGKIPLANAYAMSKLPVEEMDDFVDRAMTLAPDEFVPIVSNRVKEISEAKRKGKDPNEQEFTPASYLQKLGDIKKEHEANEIGPALIADTGAENATAGFALAIQWILHLDPKSVQVQKDKDETRRQERDDARKKRATEKASKKAEKAKVAAVEAEKAAADLTEINS